MASWAGWRNVFMNEHPPIINLHNNVQNSLCRGIMQKSFAENGLPSVPLRKDIEGRYQLVVCQQNVPKQVALAIGQALISEPTKSAHLLHH